MRSKPFSGKQKKAQLQEKKYKKKQQNQQDEEGVISLESSPVKSRKPRGYTFIFVFMMFKLCRLVSEWDTLLAQPGFKPNENPAYVQPITLMDQVHLLRTSVYIITIS